MLRSTAVWIAALWVGLMIHVDWHLGRTGSDHRSFHLAYHWLSAIPTFVPIAWFVVRRWSESKWSAAWFILLLGIALGQVVEPLGEMLLFPGFNPFSSVERWRTFSEFTAAGVITLVIALTVLQRRRAAPLQTDRHGTAT